LANLIASLQGQKSRPEKSRSATPSTIESDVASVEGTSVILVRSCVRVQKTRFFLKKKPNPVGFLGFWVLLGFFGQAGKIGKIMQKTVT